jgi:hypothetical protein
MPQNILRVYSGEDRNSFFHNLKVKLTKYLLEITNILKYVSDMWKMDCILNWPFTNKFYFLIQFKKKPDYNESGNVNLILNLLSVTIPSNSIELLRYKKNLLSCAY